MKNKNILTNQSNSKESKRGHLTLNKSLPFKIAIEHKLDNNFDFKDLSTDGLKKFSEFINEILGKNLTISQVENLLLRTKQKPIEKRFIKDEFVSEIHLGKDRSSFRLFGYFNQDSYFVITKIDPNHNFHKA
ncbi:MAG6450 family protein [Mycoplasma yeatsii]|uniref:Uncharacterized protein n=1 Tax=Mycoplasma yeatsii TaxID=51365 RepID=A0ABU0ND74_9MOLU|nr:hypothetical protein [Mycoplasma yeatsii]MDQ0567403.1 hypothetical protein [Mycoplasma yeatsii]